jgi:hypothetical protein
MMRARALGWIAGLLSLGLAGAAGAQQATCVTACQDKVGACAAQCESLTQAAYDDPPSLRECQLGCARGVFVSCVQRCNETGEVVTDDVVIVAPDADHVPPDARPLEPSEPAEPAPAAPPAPGAPAGGAQTAPRPAGAR